MQITDLTTVQTMSRKEADESGLLQIIGEEIDASILEA